MLTDIKFWWSIGFILCGGFFLKIGTFGSDLPYLRLILNLIGGPLLCSGACLVLLTYLQSKDTNY